MNFGEHFRKNVGMLKSEQKPVFPLPLKDRIRLAREHMDRHGQTGDALWPHQRFAISISELLDVAERGA